MRKVVFVALAFACGSVPARPTLSGPAIEAVARPAIVTVVAGEKHRDMGLVVDASGLVATPIHIVEAKTDIRVVLRQDDTQYPATVVAADAAHGVALLRISAQRTLPTVRLASAPPSPGQRLYEISGESVHEGSLRQVRRIAPTLEVLEVKGVDLDRWSGPILDEHGDVVGLSAAFIADQNIVIGIPVRYVSALLDSATQ